MTSHVSKLNRKLGIREFSNCQLFTYVNVDKVVVLAKLKYSFEFGNFFAMRFLCVAVTEIPGWHKLSNSRSVTIADCAMRLT